MFLAKILYALLWNMVIFGGLLFLPAGTLHWWRAWVFLGVVFAGVIITMVGVFRENEALWNERLKPPIQPDQLPADQIITSLLILTFLGLIALIPLDVFHFHLLPQPGAFVSALGLLLFIAGWGMVHLAFQANPFAAPVVKHQVDRQQTVIDTGIYRIVRHPLYTGMVLLMVGMSLWLESSAAALLAIVPTAILVVRIGFEEQFLKQELQGYDRYTEQVRYRLVPYLW